MVKVPRKVGIAIALSGLLFLGGCAYGISKIKFDMTKTVIKGAVTPLEEFSGILLNEDLVYEFANFEYQFLLGSAYSRNNEYEKATSAFEKAISSSKKSVGEKSFFTFGAYDEKAKIEYEHKHYVESIEDLRAALRVLPNREEYNLFRWYVEDRLIDVSVVSGEKLKISFLQQHLALTEKIEFGDQECLIHALWDLGRTLDDERQYTKSDPVWRRMFLTARSANYPSTRRSPWLYAFANHEIDIGNYLEADTALCEAQKAAAQSGDNTMLAGVLQAQGDSQLHQRNLAEAENKFQAALLLRKKIQNHESLAYTYGCLAGVARRRNDLVKREEYQNLATSMTDEPVERAYCFWYLAYIAAQNNEASRVKKYAEEWRRLVRKEPKRGQFIFEQDMKSLLVLYPRLKHADKGSSDSKNANSEFDNLKLEHVGFDASGYYLSPQQVTKIIDVISS
jgi:tetratricopeptide (TPR) repeat protein